uniref:NAD(P)H-quinone oxidoreductase subunit 2, chloroplastic n=1 Tax=Nephroselmis olivacea TaxID=31312 RepID=NU2C_NEPOL|nr:NADH dehydrogenase subunit 2 [Nephroselmis olivacea]Q9TL07.1 RecName: Full=NAD(P)H-quinone oxidoreductase subunit 2, chloroplastic; AltName: Full=NAD(P)H dehydrogenase, subunit 2; AltName: Full=NADH-plastoquinone oxidoreductase subunit 2 [Nephroselmis olivacea]AAD54809.1 subunit 2 of NADH-plastoquinoneoxidoreductase [Nephroselmis olivacea]
MELSDILASFHASNLIPEGIVACTILLVLLLDLVYSRTCHAWLAWVAMAGLSLASVLLGQQWYQLMNLPTATMTFGGSFQADSLSLVFRAIIAMSCVLCILLSIDYVESTGTAPSEFLVLIATASLGGMLVAGSNDLLMMFVSLETLGLASYLLTGYMKRDVRSNEASLKYLLVGAASSGLFLYGISWMYGISGGHMELNSIAHAIVSLDETKTTTCALALVLMTVGVGFKVAAAPFHQWTPDVYQGSPTPVVAFLSVGSKAAGFILAVRMCTTLFPSFNTEWHLIFTILSILSMIVGNFIAVTQTSLKRMLGYSSVGQAGVMMIGMLTDSPDGYASLIVYLLIYLFMNLGAFACVILFGLRTGTDQIQDYSGLLARDPFLALCLSLCLLSLGGIPPLAGFFGKMYLFLAAWDAGQYSLVWVGLITSVVSIYYYLSVVKIMLVPATQEMSLAVREYPRRAWSLEPIQPLEVGIFVCVLGSILVGVAGNSMVNLMTITMSQAPSLGV